VISLDVQSLAQLFADRMLNSAAEGILLAGVVWLLLRLIRRQNSRTRFAIWMMALVAVVSLPFLSGAERISPLAVAPGLAHLHLELLLPRSWALYLFAAWAAGAALLLTRLAVGLWRLRRLRALCVEADPASLDPTLLALLHGARGGKTRAPVRLCLSEEVAAPAVIGFLRPAIVFPSRLLPQLSAAEMESILLHELAHIERGDPWTNLAQKLLKALFFFHPAVWWIESQLTLEREMACDDMVLSHRGRPRAYAAVLVALAERLHSAPAIALAQALLSRVHPMSRRISQILDARRPKGAALGKPILGGGVLLIVLALGTAPYAPRLVAFHNSTSTLAAEAHPATETSVIPAVQAAAANTVQPGGNRPMPVRATWQPSEAPAAQLAEIRWNDAQRSRLHSTKPASAAAAAAKGDAGSGEAPSAIPADFHPRKAAPPVPLAQDTQPEPSLASERVPQQIAQAPSAGPAAYVIVQTTTVDASGSRIWTLCIWKVEGAERQLESAITLEI